MTSCFRSQITWAHGALLFHSGKRRSRHTRVTVSSKGCIKIKNIEPFDSGTYTCMGEYLEGQIQVFIGFYLLRNLHRISFIQGIFYVSWDQFNMQ